MNTTRRKALFGSAPKGWGMHSAFGSRGEIIDFLHFTCGASRPAAATRSDAGDRAPKRFMLRFSDAYLVQPAKARPQIVDEGSALSYGSDWQVRRLKPYLYHLRQDNWQQFFWKVNTSRKELYRVTGGQFGRLGGRDEKLDITVEPVY
ncbi:MAG: hypothetical protein ABW153_04560 [Sedimenticola sp.]